MNKILLVLLLAPVISYCQGEFPVKEGKVIYELIDSSTNFNSEDLYGRSKFWIANTFKNSKQVIQIDDKENGQIMGKGNFEISQTMTGYIIRFSFKINIKEGKYRLQFYDIFSQQDTKLGREFTAESLNEKKAFGNVKEKMNNRFIDLLDQFRIAMVKKSDNSF